MTRAEAEKEAKELNSREPQWTCPLLGGKPCRKDCVNHMPAYVESSGESCNGKRKSVTLHKVDDDDFYVDGWACSNYMFLGPMHFSCEGE